MYAKIETERLNYKRNNQPQLRVDNYIHHKGTVGRLDGDATQLGQMVVLPSSFTGSATAVYNRSANSEFKTVFFRRDPRRPRELKDPSAVYWIL